MNQRTDVGWWLFGTDDPPSNWTNPAFSGGMFSGTTASANARLFLCLGEQPDRDAEGRGRLGHHPGQLATAITATVGASAPLVVWVTERPYPP